VAPILTATVTSGQSKSSTLLKPAASCLWAQIDIPVMSYGMVKFTFAAFCGDPHAAMMASNFPVKSAGMMLPIALGQTPP
jgi:hypothetical protein